MRKILSRLFGRRKKFVVRDVEIEKTLLWKALREREKVKKKEKSLRR